MLYRARRRPSEATTASGSILDVSRSSKHSTGCTMLLAAGVVLCRTDTHDPFYEENMTVVIDILNGEGLRRRLYPLWPARNRVDH